jgi:hypothetical protein
MNFKENKLGSVALILVAIFLIGLFFVNSLGDKIERVKINEKTINNPQVPTQFRGFVGKWKGVWVPSSNNTKEESEVTVVIGDVKPGEDIVVAYSWKKNTELNIPAGFIKEKGSVNQAGHLIVTFDKEPLMGARLVLKPGPLVKNDTGGEWVNAIEGEYLIGEKVVLKSSLSRQPIR